MAKTLVIILSETRAHELTFSNFKENVVDRLNADLCLCIGVKPDYNYDNPFYRLAKYKFLYNEPYDFGDAFDYAYNTLCLQRHKYEILENINTLFCKIENPNESTDDIHYYGEYDKIENLDDFDKEDDEIVFHTKDFPYPLWKNKVFGIKKGYSNYYIHQKNVTTYKKPLHWREFLKIKDQFMGGVFDQNHQHPGSAGILLFFRWFLLKNLVENDLINQYDRFIITRSDYIYQLPHPPLELMNEKFIWIPDDQHYGGYTDRHAVLSKTNIESYLNIIPNMVLRSNEYYMKMMSENKNDWNLEQLIRFHLKQNGVLNLVKESPYVMYTVRNINGSTRWMYGDYSQEHGYYIKYAGEYHKSSQYKKKFENSGLSIDEFYRSVLFRDSLSSS
jgi:hypothetical protein